MRLLPASIYVDSEEIWTGKAIAGAGHRFSFRQECVNHV